ncbi:hypothetical protein H5J24_13380 [Chryseobacterium capnotolerans]|nr:hypothetical protein [Chryseobacterium capnotolerans]UHO40895.1 hypothetical protein H5J24_13380 [Chryseobacterium capnotolerans]
MKNLRNSKLSRGQLKGIAGSGSIPRSKTVHPNAALLMEDKHALGLCVLM